MDEVYHVPGNVDIETGHIKHPGAVLVDGDVLAGARVEADGDIEVRGTVEASYIHTGGSLTVHGGIAGMGEGTVKAAGSVYAKYILEADMLMAQTW